MKNFMSLVCASLVMISLNVEISAQSLIPPLKLDGYTLAVTGTSRSTLSSEKLPNGQYFDSNLMRLRFDLQTPDPKIKGFVEIEAIDASDPESNWLRMAYASYQINDDWVVRGGRIFLAAPYFTTPPYFLLETVHFPNEPWGYYAYGVQVEGKLASDLSLIADVSAKSGVAFDQSENFDRLETSGRLEKQFSESLSIGLIYQFSDDFVRGGADFHFSSGAGSLYGEVYASHENGLNSYGGYILSNYELSRNIVPHLQFDLKHTDPSGNDFIVTPGIMFRTSKENVRFIIDYEWHANEPERSGVYGALQIRF